MIDYVTTISQLGFSVFVCIWLMFFFKKSIDNNTNILGELRDLIREKLK